MDLMKPILIMLNSIRQVVSWFFVNNDEDNGWKKFSLAFNYDIANNFDNEFVASGIGNTSIDQYFLSFAQGQALGPLLIQDGELIEEAYLDIGANLGFGAQQAFFRLFWRCNRSC